MPEIIYKLHHSSLLVKDTAESLKMYCGVLGLQQTERPELPYPGAWLQIGEQQIHLIELDNPDPVTGRPAHGGHDRHVALTVTDLTPVLEVLEKAGIVYSMSKSGRRALFFRDPDANAIEIIERP